MNWNTVPCVSDFKTPHDKEQPDFDLIALEKMANLDADMLLDAMDVAGSVQCNMKMLAKILKNQQYDLAELSSLYSSVLGDLKELAEKEWMEKQ